MHAPRGSRLTAGLWTIFILFWWVATAFIARLPSVWAVTITSPAFALGLLWIYIGVWNVALVRAQNPRIVWMRAITVTIVSVLGLVLLEAPAAGGWLDYAAVRGALTGAWHGPADDFVDDPVLSFRRPPLSHWSGFPQSAMAQVFNLPIHSAYRQTFSTDARGFRNPAALDRADIAIIGDSYVEGAYVSDEETVAVRLGELTHAKVANLGVSGYGTLQEEIIFDRYALPLHPRMVVWFFFEGNDLDDDQSFEDMMLYEDGVRKPRVAEPWNATFRRLRARSLTWNAFEELRQISDPLVPNAIDSAGWFRDATGNERELLFFDFYATRQLGPFERARLEKAEAAFLRVAARCRERGIRLVVGYVPIKFRVYGSLCSYPAGSRCPQWHPWDLESLFAAFCRENGIEYMPLTEPMRQAASAGAVLYAPEDSHWSSDGHRFVAGLIQERWDKPTSLTSDH